MAWAAAAGRSVGAVQGGGIEIDRYPHAGRARPRSATCRAACPSSGTTIRRRSATTHSSTSCARASSRTARWRSSAAAACARTTRRRSPRRTATRRRSTSSTASRATRTRTGSAWSTAGASTACPGARTGRYRHEVAGAADRPAGAPVTASASTRRPFCRIASACATRSLSFCGICPCGVISFDDVRQHLRQPAGRLLLRHADLLRDLPRAAPVRRSATAHPAKSAWFWPVPIHDCACWPMPACWKLARRPSMPPFCCSSLQQPSGASDCRPAPRAHPRHAPPCRCHPDPPRPPSDPGCPHCPRCSRHPSSAQQSVEQSHRAPRFGVKLRLQWRDRGRRRPASRQPLWYRTCASAAG